MFPRKGASLTIVPDHPTLPERSRRFLLNLRPFSPRACSARTSRGHLPRFIGERRGNTQEPGLAVGTRSIKKDLGYHALLDHRDEKILRWAQRFTHDRFSF